jgi:hypothetical protein
MNIRTTIRLTTAAMFAAQAIPALALDLTVTHFGTGMYGVPFAAGGDCRDQAGARYHVAYWRAWTKFHCSSLYGVIGKQ